MHVIPGLLFREHNWIFPLKRKKSHSVNSLRFPSAGRRILIFCFSLFILLLLIHEENPLVPSKVKKISNDFVRLECSQYCIPSQILLKWKNKPLCSLVWEQTTNKSLINKSFDYILPLVSLKSFKIKEKRTVQWDVILGSSFPLKSIS